MSRVCRPGGRVVVSDMTAPKAEIRDAMVRKHVELIEQAAR